MRELLFEPATEIFGTTMQPLYNTPHYKTDLDIKVILWLPNFSTMAFYKGIIGK